MSRRTRWILALCLALAACPSALARKWSDDELDDRFRDIDKKLRALHALESKDKTLQHRIIALEGSVREMRTTVRRLEQRLASVDTTLIALRKDFAALSDKLVARAAATPSEAGQPVTHGEPVEPEGPLAEIVGERSSHSGGFHTITGSVRNLSDDPLSFVTVRATFLDAQGNIVKTESAYTAPRVIGPGARATFKILTRDDRRVRRHRLTVQIR